MMVMAVTAFTAITRWVTTVRLTVKVSFLSRILSSVIAISVHWISPLLEPSGKTKDEESEI